MSVQKCVQQCATLRGCIPTAKLRALFRFNRQGSQGRSEESYRMLKKPSIDGRSLQCSMRHAASQFRWRTTRTWELNDCDTDPLISNLGNLLSEAEKAKLRSDVEFPIFAGESHNTKLNALPDVVQRTCLLNAHERMTKRAKQHQQHQQHQQQGQTTAYYPSTDAHRPAPASAPPASTSPPACDAIAAPRRPAYSRNHAPCPT